MRRANARSALEYADAFRLILDSPDQILPSFVIRNEPWQTSIFFFFLDEKEPKNQGCPLLFAICRLPFARNLLFFGLLLNILISAVPTNLITQEFSYAKQ
jgi:hypothetical protein